MSRKAIPASAGGEPRRKDIPQAAGRPSGQDTLYAKRPSWRLSAIDTGGPFHFRTLTPSDFDRLLQHLQGLESRSWSDIFIKAKKQNHAIEVSDLAKAAQERLKEINRDDLDRLYSIRLTGEQRLWLFFDADLAANLLWWDPEHQVCPSTKKHT